MLYGLLVTLFIFVCFLLIVLILIQQSKSSLGLGGLGGGTQLLFGGSGGQDIFQKTTWVLGALFMFGSLGLTILKTREAKTSYYFKQSQRSKNPQMPSTTPVPTQTSMPLSETE